ncbi:hypothetical protein MHYP_G00020570 [Metynnis hypsauchen]
MLAEPTLIAPEPTLLKKGHRFKRDLPEITGRGEYDPDTQPDLDPKPDYLGDDLPHYSDSDEDDSMG